MFACRMRRLAVLAAAAPLLLATAWLLVVAFAPMDWARVRVVRRLTERTGRTVKLAGIRLGACGGVTLEGLSIAEPDRPDEPWLTVAALSIDVDLPELASGRVEPSDVEARGVTARVERDADGRIAFADLLRSRHSPTTEGGSPDTSDGPTVRFRLRDSRLTVVDRPSGTTVEVTAVEGEGTWQRRNLELTELRGSIGGGTLTMAGRLDRSPAGPSFEGQARIEGAALHEDSRALRYLIPVVGGTRPSPEVDARLALDLYLRGHGDSMESLSQSLAGQGSVKVDPISLQESKLLTELEGLIDLPKSGKIGSVKGDVLIHRGRISTRNMTLTIARVPIVFAGWTDFDGRLDYRIKAEGIGRGSTSKARGLLADLPEAIEELLPTRLQGTLDHVILTVDGVPLRAGGEAPDDDRRRLREIGRRLKDRLLR